MFQLRFFVRPLFSARQLFSVKQPIFPARALSTLLPENIPKITRLSKSVFSSSLSKYNNAQLVEYLQKNKMPKFAALSQTYQHDGLGFLNYLVDDQSPPEEFKELAKLLAAQPSLSPPTPPPKNTFSTNTMIRPNQGHFFIGRRERIFLDELIETQGGFILIHGARSSGNKPLYYYFSSTFFFSSKLSPFFFFSLGKSSLMMQLIDLLDKERFVYGCMELQGNFTSMDTLWQDTIIMLASPKSLASPEVRAAAQGYLVPNSQKHSNPIMHLFIQKYGNKKLVLFWDEFDNAYKPERRETVAAALRSVNNEVKKGVLSSTFQAVNCLGAYNANLVQAAGLSPFVRDKTFSY